jgi:RNA polymerase sigma-70 factor (ECF subfamily)
MNTELAFTSSRHRLLGLAYRLLGSRSEAEDLAQEVWLRWSNADHHEIHDHEAWLVTTATRLGIDRLRALRVEREAYTGPWLPEPFDVDEAVGPETHAEVAEQVSIAFLTLLETLGPEERAAFILKEAFDYSYAGIGELLGRKEATCRQLVHRARERIHAGQPRFQTTRLQVQRLLTRFMEAASTGNQAAIRELLDADVVVVSDGGGKGRGLLRPIVGAERVVRFYWTIWNQARDRIAWRLGAVNGEPALLRYYESQLFSVTTMTIEGGRITRILNVMNPDKLPLPLG